MPAYAAPWNGWPSRLESPEAILLAAARPLSATSDAEASTNLPDHGSKPVSKRNTPVKSPTPKGSTPDRPIFDWLKPLPPMEVMDLLL